jgi:predicted secreted protein
MKKLLFVCLLLAGCKPVENAPLVPNVSIIHEVDNGKSITIVKGSSIIIELPVPNDNNFYWSVDEVKGLTVLSEAENGKVIQFMIQANEAGSIKINYQQFTDLGAKTIKSFFMKVEVK